jgi:predicted nuclease of predicted toxin-antitoxin system
MKIYCDENIEAAIIAGLRRRGIEVISARDTGDLGKSDEYHLKRASELEAVILTHDIDFLKLAHQ